MIVHNQAKTNNPPPAFSQLKCERISYIEVRRHKKKKLNATEAITVSVFHEKIALCLCATIEGSFLSRLLTNPSMLTPERPEHISPLHLCCTKKGRETSSSVSSTENWNLNRIPSQGSGVKYRWSHKRQLLFLLYYGRATQGNLLYRKSTQVANYTIVTAH